MQNLFDYNSDEFIIHHTKIEKDGAFIVNSAIHDMHELYFMIDGEGTFYVEGNAYPMKPGCLVLTRAGELHSVQMISAFYDIIAIHFRQSLFSEIDPNRFLDEPFSGRPLGQMNYYSPEILRQNLIQVYLSLICESKNPPSDDNLPVRLQIQCHLPSLLYEIRRCFYCLTSRKCAPEVQPSLTERVIGYIDRYLTEQIKLKDIAGNFFINERYLNRIFKQSTGLTIWQYIIAKRLHIAHQRIAEGLPINEVAEQTGWKDYSSFYRQYKAHFGDSPNSRNTG